MGYLFSLLGMILSAQTFTYTISKFFFSWATDHYPVRYMFAGGMFMTGFVMLAFSGNSWIFSYKVTDLCCHRHNL